MSLPCGLQTWGLPIQTSCCLCSQLEEIKDHLLLTCVFSSQIWGQILTRLSSLTTLFHNWNDSMDWSKDNSSHVPAILRKLVPQATIYHLWKQRNNVVHNHISIPTLSIFKSLDREIRNIISSRKHKNHCHNLMQLWLQ
ncbi:hypothetical protein V5N11_010404 [Cardamine amara subsp. amara]|uniref:Reverse transcriptase zinc-binding domain-containing protein n=1 Tax=Cardamine amara subsp. amara TaxID=228776 RepID=A0ABD0ZIJ8_CARAN